MRQLNVKDLQEFAIKCSELGYSEERAWIELVKFYKVIHNTTIPECGIKQVFVNILKTINKIA